MTPAQTTTSPYPSNFHIRHIGATETLLLMTLRLWCLTKRFPEREFPDWHGGLQQSDADTQTWQAMDALLNIILHHSQRLLDIRCTCNPRLGVDEGCFLQVIALIQANHHWQAEKILDEWLPDSVQGVALIHAMHLAESLRRAQIHVPLYEPTLARVYQLDVFRMERVNREANLRPSPQQLH